MGEREDGLLRLPSHRTLHSSSEVAHRGRSEHKNAACGSVATITSSDVTSNVITGSGEMEPAPIFHLVTNPFAPPRIVLVVVDGGFGER